MNSFDQPLTQSKKKTSGKGKSLPALPAGKISAHARANLQFSVSRAAKFMKQGRYADRLGGGAPVYMAATLQYICSELMELAGHQAELAKKKTIKPRHVFLAVKQDPELNEMFGDADFAACGRVPKIPQAEKKAKKQKKGREQEDEEMEDEA